MELTYALPPRSEGFDGALSVLKRYAEDLSKGATDSGAGGFLWNTEPKKPLPRPPQVPASPRRPVRPSGGPCGNGARPRFQAARAASWGAKIHVNKEGAFSVKLPSKLPSLTPSGAPGAWPSPPPPTRPLPDPRNLAVSVPRAFHQSIDLSPRRAPPRSTSPRLGLASWAGANKASVGRSVSPPPARTAVVSSWQKSSDSARGLVPRPPAAPKNKSLDEYISKACSELLNAPGQPALTWCTTDSEADYKGLQAGQFFNHFRNNKELTTKSGLAQNLLQHAVATGAKIDSFFPRSYDVGQRSEREDFILDFRRSAALKVALVHLHLEANEARRKLATPGRSEPASRGYRCNTTILRAAARTLLRWCRELDPEHIDEEDATEIPATIDERTSEALLLYSELTEAQLCSQEQEEDDMISRLPRRRHHRTSADLGDWEDSGTTAERYSTSAKRPGDVHLWLEFRGHEWRPAQQVDSSELRGAVQRLEDLFPQFGLQGGWVGRNVWIVKPGTCSKGSGVECMNILPDLLHHCDTMPNRIVQKYIERPLLLFSGRKFDIRQWVLVRSVSPLRIFLFSECYLRLCNGMYDLGDLRDRERHISNWQVNKRGRHGNVIEGAAAPLADFKAELREITGKEGFWEEALLPQLKDIVVQTMRSCEGKLAPRSENFELYGFDLMVDESMRMWLLEVNLSPGCEGRMPFLEHMLTRMSKRLIEVAVLGKEEPDGQSPDWVKICDDAADVPNLSAGTTSASDVGNRGQGRDWVGSVDLTVRGQPLRAPAPPSRQPPAKRPHPRVGKVQSTSDGPEIPPSASEDAEKPGAASSSALGMIHADAPVVGKPTSITPTTAASDEVAGICDSEASDAEHPKGRNAAITRLIDVREDCQSNAHAEVENGGNEIPLCDKSFANTTWSQATSPVWVDESSSQVGDGRLSQATALDDRPVSTPRKDDMVVAEPTKVPEVAQQALQSESEFEEESEAEAKIVGAAEPDGGTQSQFASEFEDAASSYHVSATVHETLGLPESSPAVSPSGNDKATDNDEVGGSVGEAAKQTMQNSLENQQPEDDDDEDLSDNFEAASSTNSSEAGNDALGENTQSDEQSEGFEALSPVGCSRLATDTVEESLAAPEKPRNRSEDDRVCASDDEDAEAEAGATSGGRSYEFPDEPSQHFEDDFDSASDDEEAGDASSIGSSDSKEKPALSKEEVDDAVGGSDELQEEPSQHFEDDFDPVSGDEASDNGTNLDDADEVENIDDADDDDFEMESSVDEETSQ